MRKTCLLIGILLLVCPLFSQNIQGSWNGTLNTGMMKLRIVLHIEQNEGQYTATMDSPDQGAKGIAVDSVYVTDNSLTFTINRLKITFNGTREDDEISGTFVQGVVSLPLILSRGVIAINRPQQPSPPYPYHSEEVQFENSSAGITLAGTFTYPETGKGFPVVVLVTGSGAQNRDEELMGHRPFLVLSDYLTRRGIAVLRYDDRGTAQSSGTYGTATLQDLASDALAAIHYLKTRKEINPGQIGLIGHSEGGCIAFMLAAEQKNKLAYIVSMAGMAIRGDSLLKQQRYLLSRKMGVPDFVIAQNEEILGKISIVADKYSTDYISQHLNLCLEEILPDPSTRNEALLNACKTGLMQMASPEIKSLRHYDPSVHLQQIACPVLALNGDNDLQVPAALNLNRIKELAKGKVTVKLYAGLNHLFQHSSTGLPTEYAEIEETISPQVLEDIVLWIISLSKGMG